MNQKVVMSIWVFGSGSDNNQSDLGLSGIEVLNLYKYPYNFGSGLGRIYSGSDKKMVPIKTQKNFGSDLVRV